MRAYSKIIFLIKEDYMSTTQPIRNREDLEQLKNYYLKQKPNLRNYALICTAVNTALRISDILVLKWKNVYDFKLKKFRNHLELTEKKTGKHCIVALNKSAITGLCLYRESLSYTYQEQFIFTGHLRETPLCREQAYRIIKDACHALQLPEHISCHSLRKTFGYHAWLAGTSPTLLVSIYNHSSFEVTKRYLGIEQDEKDNVFLNLEL